MTATLTCQRCGVSANAGARFCQECGASIRERPSIDLPVPERLQEALGPDYRVMGELGRGGFAVVYTAKDLRLNRYLAVKVIRPALVASEKMIKRFRQEAQFVAQLDHPHILPISFAGESGGLVYYAMPRVQGRTLRDTLREREGLSIEEALRVFRETAAALDHAHQRGIIHRDVKPANIMLETQGGRALLLDFGIAKALSPTGGNLSISGQIIGSLEYMSPEQAAGSRDVDARSDIYSLGVVAFEMLSGRLPFAGATVSEFVESHQASTVPDIVEYRADTPRAFADVIRKCLAKRPEDRWASAKEAAGRIA